jgi:hypothetical protein
MIELVPAEYDDLGFLSLARRIINGAIVELRMREVFLVHVDNWFDHKWLAMLAGVFALPVLQLTQEAQ